MSATHRPSGRQSEDLRNISITRHFTRHAEGSVLVEFGDTQVVCTASVEDSVPRFLKGKGQGWVTAEYGMLPRSTSSRMDRESARGKQSGRTQEIQRLIGRSLRAAVDMKKLEKTRSRSTVMLSRPTVEPGRHPLPVPALHWWMLCITCLTIRL